MRVFAGASFLMRCVSVLTAHEGRLYTDVFDGLRLRGGVGELKTQKGMIGFDSGRRSK